MKILPTLLMLPILAEAISLRPGASLEYRVWRSAQAKISAVRVTVLDSTLDSSQETLWNLAVQDSLLDDGTITKDTVILLHTSSTLHWKQQSSLVNWDPLPLDSAPDADVQNSSPHILPHLKWLPGVGWSRWENKDRWILLKNDGKFVDASLVPQNRLTFPMNAGDSWTWNRYDSATSTSISEYGNDFPHHYSTHLLKGTLHWKILSREADSSDWLRFTVAQQQAYHSNDSTNVQIGSDTTIQAHNADSTSDSTVALRISLMLGLTSPDILPAQGFIALWSDSIQGDGYLRKESWTSSKYDINNQNDYSFNTYFHTKSNIGLDSGYRRMSENNTGHQTAAGTSFKHDTISVCRLLSFNGTTIRTSAIASRTIQKHPILTISYLRDALQDPSARLRLIAIDGRSRELSRATWESDLRREHGLQILELHTATGILRGIAILTP